jgi:hypothetical protein
MKKTILLLLIVFITISANAQTNVTNLPKCGKYCLHIKNGCHWWLASRTKNVMGYVIITNGETDYFDADLNRIYSKDVISYGRLTRHPSKNKCYRPTCPYCESAKN